MNNPHERWNRVSLLPQFYGWRRTDIPHTHGNGFTLATGTGFQLLKGCHTF
jgi:hypothetical protein